MQNLAHAIPFLEALYKVYDGKAGVKIEVDQSFATFEGGNPKYLRLVIWLLLGNPKAIGGELLYPVEIPALVTYDAARDGQKSWDQSCDFMMARMLDVVAFPGASRFLMLPHTKRAYFAEIRDYLCGNQQGQLILALTN